ncbi:MAG: uroporphyrinogen decarboxylase family protein [Candidatus Moduliflexus flocculans]|nr:uroporphyrinogen decarboxylase family protein [Candidatus Moduliflexus flocculans]
MTSKERVYRRARGTASPTGSPTRNSPSTSTRSSASSATRPISGPRPGRRSPSGRAARTRSPRAGSRTTSPCSGNCRSTSSPSPWRPGSCRRRTRLRRRGGSTPRPGRTGRAGSTGCRRRRRTSPASTIRSRDARVFTAEEFGTEPGPARRDERSWKILDAVVREFKDEKFICGPSGGSVGIVLLGGMERGLLEIGANPDVVRAATRSEVRRQNAADAVMIHPDSDAVLWAEDLGYKTGPLIGPATFRDLFLEANKERVASVKGRYGKKILKHCCGNINLLMDFFVDIGFDAYQSIQPTAGMDICRLKRDYGGRIALWGGVAVEHLVGGTPEDVRADVRRAMACAKPGGRFILGASHSVAVGTQYDNYMALLDEHARLCQY